MTTTSARPSTRAGNVRRLPHVSLRSPRGPRAALLRLGALVTDSVSDFVERLAAVPTVPGRNNFFDQSVPENALRRRNLELYLEEMLERSPAVLLLGEAPGFRGMRITGVPFTNRTMFRGPANSFGLFGPGKGYVLPPEAADVAAERTA